MIIIGALGRCGKGALDLAYKAGIPRYTLNYIECTNVWFQKIFFPQQKGLEIPGGGGGRVSKLNICSF